jgi:enoyl-CoA hydratase
MTLSTTAVRVERRGDVSLVTIDDGKANAVSLELVDGLLRVIAAEATSSRALVLAGRPGMFCAGLDLAVVRGEDRGRFRELLERGTELYQLLLQSPVPVVAACTGHALAGGAVLLLCCDYRIGLLGNSKIGLSEVSIGIAMSEFVSRLAQLRLAGSHFVRATVLAEVTGPDGAVLAGFLDEVVDDDVVTAAVRRAEVFAQLPGRAYAAQKQTAYRALEHL